MKRYSLFLAPMVLALLANGLSTGCSGGDDNGDAGDGGTTDGPVKKDVATLDVQQDTTPPQVVTPSGKQLFSSNLVQIFGVTTDNFVIFADNGTGGALYAADATGTNPAVQIAAPTVSTSATYIVGISGKVVFLWENVNPKATQQVGKLSAWISTGALKQLSAASNASSGFNSSTDGTKVMFSSNSNAGGTSGDIVGANVDGTSPSTLVSGTDIADGGCTPLFGFAGGVNPIVATCAADPGDGGIPVATVKTFTTAWAATALTFAGLNFWSSNSAGDKLLLATTASLEVSPTDGSSLPVTIDAKDIQGGGFGYMEKDGNNVLYASVANDLYTAPTTSPVPVQLEASGVKYFRSISPDDKYMLYSSTLDSKQFGSDIYLQSTSTAGKTTLVSGTTGALFGLVSTDDFTTDSKYVLYIANVNNATFTGDLMYMAVGGTTGTKLGSDEWLNLSATGSKIVYNDNCQGCGTNSANQVIGVADIESVDVSTATPTPTKLQAGADPQIYISAPKDRVIFTYSQNVPADDGGVLPAGNGLYSIAIP